MQPVMRAKMRVTRVERVGVQENIHMTAVCKAEGYSEDGLDEDNTFSTFTPQAEITMTVMNPVLYGAIIPEDVFYVDFTKVPEPCSDPK